LTRRYRFSASHRLDTPVLSPEENRRIYGKCNNPYGHGHNYVLDVTLEGPVDASGQMVNREALDTLVSERVLARLDHRNLNVEVPELGAGVPTTENLALTIQRMLGKDWPLAPALRHVRISETDRNIFDLEMGT
jgi:6-pyruvoyltetrahydropterin/6-carboxytetrahydropterin synthase